MHILLSPPGEKKKKSLSIFPFSVLPRLPSTGGGRRSKEINHLLRLYSVPVSIIHIFFLKHTSPTCESCCPGPALGDMARILLSQITR